MLQLSLVYPVLIGTFAMMEFGEDPLTKKTTCSTGTIHLRSPANVGQHITPLVVASLWQKGGTNYLMTITDGIRKIERISGIMKLTAQWTVASEKNLAQSEYICMELDNANGISHFHGHYGYVEIKDNTINPYGKSVNAILQALRTPSAGKHWLVDQSSSRETCVQGQGIKVPTSGAVTIDAPFGMDKKNSNQLFQIDWATSSARSKRSVALVPCGFASIGFGFSAGGGTCDMSRVENDIKAKVNQKWESLRSTVNALAAHDDHKWALLQQEQSGVRKVLDDMAKDNLKFNEFEKQTYQDLIGFTQETAANFMLQKDQNLDTRNELRFNRMEYLNMFTMESVKSTVSRWLTWARNNLREDNCTSFEKVIETPNLQDSHERWGKRD